MADNGSANSENQRSNNNINQANYRALINPNHFSYTNSATIDNHPQHRANIDDSAIISNLLQDSDQYASYTNSSLMDPNTNMKNSSPTYINASPNTSCSSINPNPNPDFFSYGGSGQHQSSWSELYFSVCSQESKQPQACSFPSSVDPQVPAGFPKQETVYSNQSYLPAFMADGPHLKSYNNNIRNYDNNVRPNSTNYNNMQRSHQLINANSMLQYSQASTTGANYCSTYPAISCSNNNTKNNNYILPSLASGNFEHLVPDMDQCCDVKPAINDGLVANPGSVYNNNVNNHGHSTLISDQKSSAASVLPPFSLINNYGYRKSGAINIRQNQVGLKRPRQQDRQNIINGGYHRAATPSESVITSQPKPKTLVPKKRKTMQKKVVCVPATGGPDKPTGDCIPSDSWAWRKYGQKPIKGSPYPRSYYRCSSLKGCTARKQVERNPSDPMMIIVTYTSDHSHSSSSSSAVNKEGEEQKKDNTIDTDQKSAEEEEDKNNMEGDLEVDEDMEEDQSSSTDQLAESNQSHGLIKISEEGNNINIDQDGISSPSINDQASENSIDETLPIEINDKCNIANDNSEVIRSEIKDDMKGDQSGIINGRAEDLDDISQPLIKNDHLNHQQGATYNDQLTAYGADMGQSSRITSVLGDDEFDFSGLGELTDYNQLILDYQATNHLDSTFDHLFMAPNWSN